MRYDINFSSAIKIIEFDTKTATVGVAFTTSPKIYRYNVSGDYAEVKESIMGVIVDEEQSLGSHINRLIRNNTLELIQI